MKPLPLGFLWSLDCSYVVRDLYARFVPLAPFPESFYCSLIIRDVISCWVLVSLLVFTYQIRSSVGFFRRFHLWYFTWPCS
ncbi:hypothetical protein AALP_AA4G118800 [Arabis alpina]|uniref:Uncharacterized protein n=1 Tax=Arabis alpina TaxID=50452 RepID=A0A087H2P3_ARAAL|nr:hypothetical protein AALP_AA4G118800 [Arabis alpina]